MKISFSTLGCPGWDLETICRNGRDYGFQGVDFRGYLDSLDITTLPQFTTQAGRTRQRLADAGLEVSAISTSITLCAAEQRLSNLAEACRTIDVARALGCRNVRVFGGGDPAHDSLTDLAKVGAGCLQEILGLDGAAELLWLFETHDLWVKSQDCRLLLDRIPNPAFGALWDIGNITIAGGELPAETYATIGARVGYVHMKDAVYDPGHPLAMSDGWRYVMPGCGQFPLRESLKLLAEGGYDGWLLFEHEKRWHPELPEPEAAFPAFGCWMGTFSLAPHA